MEKDGALKLAAEQEARAVAPLTGTQPTWAQAQWASIKSKARDAREYTPSPRPARHSPSPGRPRSSPPTSRELPRTSRRHPSRIDRCAIEGLFKFGEKF
ncbi:unnamed protein product [Urochloa humidicola]